MERRRHPSPLRCALAASAVLGLAALVPGRPGAALAGSPAAGADVRAALEQAKASGRSKSAAERARSAESLAGRDDPAIARELLARLRREPEPVVQTAILRALGGQAASGEDVSGRVKAWLRAEAESERRREKAGDPGFPVDPRTGEPALWTEEGRRALDLGAARAAARVEAIAALERLAADVARDVAGWTPFLQDPADDLVIAVLRALGRARCEAALPDLVALFRMYPSASTWETGAVTDLAGTNATAKRTWMVRFGHPEKQKARPRVFAAMADAIETITGRRYADPEALASSLASAARAGTRAKGSR